MKLSILLLGLCACGGEPFSAGEALHPDAREAGDDAEVLPDSAQIGTDSAPATDSGTPDVRTDSSPLLDSGNGGQEGGQDAGQDSEPTEASTDSGTMPDVVAPACPNSLAPGEYGFFSAHSGPATFSTPATCAACSAYTCACILANDARLNTDAGFQGCTCMMGANAVAYVACQ